MSAVSRLEIVLKSLYRIIKPVNNITSSAGMVCLAGMMFLTAADVFLRYSLNKPILGVYELVQYMMCITIVVGLTYCGLEKGHIAIDTVTLHLSRRARAIVNSITALLGLIVASLITWQTCIYIIVLRESQQVSTTLLIPMYPFVAIVALGVAFFCVVLVLHFLEFILEGIRK
jgi:TRAP-type C4-dicarboxylate transport system permease small subunit